MGLYLCRALLKLLGKQALLHIHATSANSCCGKSKSSGKHLESHSFTTVGTAKRSLQDFLLGLKHAASKEVRDAHIP